MNGAEAPENHLPVLCRALMYFSRVGCRRPSFGSFGRKTPISRICPPTMPEVALGEITPGRRRSRQLEHPAVP
jgi:hypothetical protein